MRGTKSIVALAIVACANLAHAEYPEKPIMMVVPFAPGGVADNVARPLAAALSRELKQPVVIENKAGAGGAVGIGHVARAPADGYTLLLSLSSISILPEADKVLGRKALYQLPQLRPLARITADPPVLVVRADSPWRTVEDFVADAKRKPSAFNYGSSGNYGTMHVPMEMFKAAAGFQMTHIPFTGAGPAVTALLGKQVDAVATGPASVLQYIKAGKLRALAHWGDKPPSALPELPSLQQKGWKVQYVQWSGVFAPSGTSEATLRQLRDALRRATSDASLQQTVLRAGSPIDYLDAPAFATYWQQDAKAMTEAVQKIGRLE
ncbi:tripartite tricarboxylate transporter substrate binding protein (plasmid) [Cupriavidus sp. P-10]|uniref:tripartite tricarboxylate transporter substrate binding protein n=1 Tax=Cupriavidus sp. P-10 TaxID=2027911 RepID=UPI000E2EF7DE|nr:tripartite tricarboxylate transporter substrate binding protein [Cupriavidus sp. P-10]BDB29424.1 tripartite tricarboxylate transporter substrate binding protein [Cupriavidus sp. P-10]